MTSPAPMDAQVVRIPVAVLGIGIRSPMRSRGATARPAWRFMSPMRWAEAADFGLSIRPPGCHAAGKPANIFVAMAEEAGVGAVGLAETGSHFGIGNFVDLVRAGSEH